MASMFSSCIKVTTFGISNFNSENVNSNYCMFNNCNLLNVNELRDINKIYKKIKYLLQDKIIIMQQMLLNKKIKEKNYFLVK